MNFSSNSTKLINCLIALSTKNSDFPHPLYDNGYQLETIEPKIILPNAKIVNPDIQFKKNNDHLVFFECKDGNVEKDQLDRYKSLTLKNIQQSKITSLPTDEFSFDLAYFCTKEKEEKIIPSVEYDGNPFPILILDQNQIYRNCNSAEFNYTQMGAIFQNIEISSPVPESYIPFTVDDNDQVIVINLLQHLMQRFDYEFTIEGILEELFPHYIHFYSEKGINELKSRLGRILSKLVEADEFSEVLRYRKGERKYVFNPSGPKKFRNACKKYIEKCEDELKDNSEPQSQKTLFEFPI